jgi:hypothetical protein
VERRPTVRSPPVIRTRASLEIFSHIFDFFELVIRWEAKNCAGVLERRVTVDAEGSVAAPEPEVVTGNVVYADGPGMYVSGPAVQEFCRQFVVAKILEISYVMRFVRGYVSVLLDGHELAVVRGVIFVQH